MYCYHENVFTTNTHNCTDSFISIPFVSRYNKIPTNHVYVAKIIRDKLHIWVLGKALKVHYISAKTEI